MTAKTFTVRGHKIRTQTQRRFVAVVVKTDKWAVMNTVTSSWGHDFHEVARDERTGFRAIFDTEAEAVAACGSDQVVKVWSVAGAEIIKRSDSVATVRKAGGTVVVDTETGEEV